MVRALAVSSIGLFLVALAGCGTRSVLGGPAAGRAEGGADANAPATGGAPATPLAHLAVDLEPLERPRGRTRVRVVVTDETGSARLREVGVFEGECADVSARARAEPIGPALAVDCRASGGRTVLRMVVRGPALVVLRAIVDDGSPSAPEFDQVARIDLPSGARVLTDFD